ncbi:hypothetical protein [Streptomyces thermolilacinus]|uniref:hypothetical protein n=1 Tax=Streptomyces thermolilacinus TaxID=285540 RepID=UPI0033F2A238
MSDCTICTRPMAAELAHRTACPRCGSRLAAWLEEIPRQLAALADCLEPDGRGDGTGRSAGRAHAPLPVRLDVLTLIGPAAPHPVRDTSGDQAGPVPVAGVLHAWADRLAEDLGTYLPRMRTTSAAAYAAYLARHMAVIVTREWVAPLYEEVQETVRRLRAVTRTEPQRRPLEAPCPRCSAVGLVEVDWEVYRECTVCGLLLTADEYKEHAARLYRLGLGMVLAAAGQAADQDGAA